MQLEDYFDFLSPDDIRIKGHRIGVDNVLEYYLEGYSPEEIQAALPTLTLEQIYATITYYLHNQAEMDSYLSRVATQREQHYQQWTPSQAAQRIRAIKEQQGRYAHHEDSFSAG